MRRLERVYYKTSAKKRLIVVAEAGRVMKQALAVGARVAET